MQVEIISVEDIWNFSHILAGIAASLCAIVAAYLWLRRPSSKNPFTLENVTEPGPVELDTKKRDKVIKQGFKIDKVPQDLDVIVIGSGLGGLSCAACLARAGKRVLVLEQHDRAGGCTHTYEEKGFEFDIGLHYIGQLHPGTLNHTLFKVLSDGQLVWETLDKEFDSVVIRQSDGKDKFYNLVSGKGDFEQRLIEHFPNEEKAIMEFINLMKKCSKSIYGYMMLKMLPKPVLKLMITLRLYKFWSFGFDEAVCHSLKDVLDRLTDNKELKTVLGYCFGDYGTVPSKVPFFMHALLLYHFYRDSYYPRGGASEIAYTMIPAILRNGGAVLVRAPVSRIIVENGKAVGVTVTKGDSEHYIYAKSIVSNAGAYNTYGRLLPQELSTKLGLNRFQKKIGHGMSCLQILVGLKGSSEELGLLKRNYWVFSSNEGEEDMDRYLSLSREDAVNTDFPILFISFPSTKDSTWSQKHPGKSVCVVVTFSNWEWFQEWNDNRVMKRGHVYQDLKRTFQDRAWQQILKLFPQFEGKVEYIDTGTPVTHSYYISSPKGEIYGADHTMKRFTHKIAMDMRPKTQIPGLYLTGQDVMTCGIVPAAISGAVSASQVLGRNLMKDIYLLSAKLRKEKKKSD